MKTKKIVVGLFCSMIILMGCQPDQRTEKMKESTEAEAVQVTSGASAATNATSVKQEEQTNTNDQPKESAAKVSYERNGHTFEVDAVSGPTVEANNGQSGISPEEKAQKMYWSGRPEIGEVQGDYYHHEVVFDGGYTALIDVVVKDQQIQLVEFDERGPKNYYSEEWAGVTKRLSGYANFQANNARTDQSLVTVVNTMTFLENQMVTENRLDGAFQTAKGQSNSANNGYLPAARALAKEIKEPSKEHYTSLTEDFGEGLSGRLTVITLKDSGKIIDLRYDEYFADTEEEIKDAKLKAYSRQSKYFSKDYAQKSGENFKKEVDDLRKKAIEENKLVSPTNEEAWSENYQRLVKKITSQ
ncbi:hypothetical protein [Enterococcus faecalis]|uniref:hypothetical protein n=1 Tax=Enterococcus faecalis TaxID=1351 RepID=UPI0035CB48F8